MPIRGGAAASQAKGEARQLLKRTETDETSRKDCPTQASIRMGNSERPYLSVVVASRNDGYTGNMLRRLQVFVESVVAQVERFRLSSELILVDWNPPPDKELWEAIRWPATLRACTIRVITVPPRLHDQFPLASSLPILVHRARNVGIRRARGLFVLPTSQDILLSDEIAEWIGRRELDPSKMYRVARRDVPENALDYDSHEERLAYCREHVRVVHERIPSHRISRLPDLFTNAAGDFTMLSRDMYFNLRGIPEEREFHSMHFDSIFCFMAHAAGALEHELMDPLRIYHVDHGTPSWRPATSWLARVAARVPPSLRRSRRVSSLLKRIARPRSMMDRQHVPHLDCSTKAGRAQYEALIRRVVLKPEAFRYNDVDWGMGKYSLEERVLGPAPLKAIP